MKTVQQNLLALAVVLLYMGTASCKRESTIQNDAPFLGKLPAINGQAFFTPDTGFTLVFQDDFNGTSLNTANWSYRTGVVKDCSNLSRNVSVDSGNLKIDLKAEVYGSTHYTAGGIITKATYKYGFYETRAKLPAQSGWHSSFWLYGSTNEIDCFEVESLTPTTLYTNTHHWETTPPTSPGWVAHTVANTSQAFHTYGFEWTPTVVNYYVDSVLIRRDRYYEPHAFQQLFLTSLTLTSGANDEVYFDYFKAYSKNYPTEVLVDNDDTTTGYSEAGSGWNASSLPGYIKGTRYSGTLGAYAKWTPNVTVAGTYKVYVYKIQETNSDPNAKITIYHNGLTDYSYTNYATGTSGWVDVGNYYFAAGTGGYITNTLNTTGKWCRADAVRIVKQ